jgi:hypothetical protein
MFPQEQTTAAGVECFADRRLVRALLRRLQYMDKEHFTTTLNCGKTVKERRHRGLGDRTRVELLQCGETPAVLPYVMLYAARMVNCMPRADGRIPWVLVHGCPVLWELMRPFAHACVVRIVEPGNKRQSGAAFSGCRWTAKRWR